MERRAPFESFPPSERAKEDKEVKEFKQAVMESKTLDEVKQKAEEKKTERVADFDIDVVEPETTESLVPELDAEADVEASPALAREIEDEGYALGPLPEEQLEVAEEAFFKGDLPSGQKQDLEGNAAKELGLNQKDITELHSTLDQMLEAIKADPLLAEASAPTGRESVKELLDFNWNDFLRAEDSRGKLAKFFKRKSDREKFLARMGKAAEILASGQVPPPLSASKLRHASEKILEMQNRHPQI